jgi:hypothetical protein
VQIGGPIRAFVFGEKFGLKSPAVIIEGPASVAGIHVAANETLAGLDVDQFICFAIVKQQKLMSKNVASTRSEERSVASLPRQKDISALSVAPSEFDARLVHVSTLHRPPAPAPGTSSALASMYARSRRPKRYSASVRGANDQGSLRRTEPEAARENVDQRGILEDFDARLKVR